MTAPGLAVLRDDRLHTRKASLHMIQQLRSRLRIVVATAICALVAAPAVITGTATIAAAAPPGVATTTLTVGGQGTANPWQFHGGFYSELQAAIQNPDNFGPNGVFKKG